MKASNCELKGIRAYLNLGLPELQTPLVALIDYLGHRMVVTSLLPLGKGSLVYGSDNQAVICSILVV
jgi:hypothetical protein